PGGEAPGLEIVPAEVAQADVAMGDRLAHLAGDVEARQRLEPHRIREEAYFGGAAAARFGRRGARMIEEQLRRRGVLAEDGDAGVRRQMELRAADRNRLAQARGQPRHALADRFASRT